MGFLAVNWVVSAMGLLALANVLPGFRVLDFQSALIATSVVGLFSSAVAPVLRRMSSPGAFAISATLLVLLDTFLFRVTALLVPGFAMGGFFPAFAGALLLFGLHLALLRVRVKGRALHSEPVGQL